MDVAGRSAASVHTGHFTIIFMISDHHATRQDGHIEHGAPQPFGFGVLVPCFSN